MIHAVQIGAPWQHTENVLRDRDGGFEMKLRRIIPMALAAYAGWNKLSPQQRASMKRKITSSGAGQPAQ
jgi:hypothetical protein